MNVSEQLGEYRLVEKLSVGGMAEVYLAVREGLREFSRVLAVKCILPSLASDSSFVEMFIDEARITGQLNHPNIVQAHYLGAESGIFYIVVEYLPGIDLLSVFRVLKQRNERVPPEIAAFIGKEVCRGLHHAHTLTDELGKPQRIVHRDCSPQNIVLLPSGEVKLIDFGIAKAEERLAQTRAGIRKGKYRYMAPEQLDGRDVDARTDLFSLSTVIWECLAGRPAFDQSTDFQVAAAIRDGNYSRPSLHVKDIPEALEDVVMRGMSLHPEDRPTSCLMMLKQLQSAVEYSRNQEQENFAAWVKYVASEELTVHQKRMERLVQPRLESSDIAKLRGSTKIIK